MLVFVHVSSDEHQTLGVDPALALRPLGAPPRHVRPIAFAGDHGFFEAEFLGVNEIPPRSIIDLKAALSQFADQPAQGEGAVPNPPRQKGRVLTGDRLGLAPAYLARRDAPRLPKPSHPIDHRARRDPESRRRPMPRQPLLQNPSHRALAKIHRIRFSHPYWPPAQPAR